MAYELIHSSPRAPPLEVAASSQAQPAVALVLADTATLILSPLSASISSDGPRMCAANDGAQSSNDDVPIRVVAAATSTLYVFAFYRQEIIYFIVTILKEVRISSVF